MATGGEGPDTGEESPLAFDPERVGTGHVDREIVGPAGPMEGDLERAIAAQVRAYRQASGISVAPVVSAQRASRET